MVRATMLEILESDYIKAAWAVGLPRRRVIYGDALLNVIIPVITVLGVVFGFLMAGNAVVESVFAWPGIGNYAVASLMTKDFGPIQSFVLFVALMYVVVNFVVDLVYGVDRPADPDRMMAERRSRYAGSRPLPPRRRARSSCRRLRRNKLSSIGSGDRASCCDRYSGSLDRALRSERPMRTLSCSDRAGPLARHRRSTAATCSPASSSPRASTFSSHSARRPGARDRIFHRFVAGYRGAGSIDRDERCVDAVMAFPAFVWRWRSRRRSEAASPISSSSSR